MKITASVKNSAASHEVVVATDGRATALLVPAKANAPGSAVNGGEFLMLALATCYCNDLYREAARLGLILTSVEVEASAHFEGVGLAARNIQYRARIESSASSEQLTQLLEATDAVAEVHNTLRTGAAVELGPWVG